MNTFTNPQPPIEAQIVDLDRMLTVHATAERTGVSIMTIRKRCREGLIAGAVQIAIGRTAVWFIPADAVIPLLPRGRPIGPSLHAGDTRLSDFVL